MVYLFLLSLSLLHSHLLFSGESIWSAFTIVEAIAIVLNSEEAWYDVKAQTLIIGELYSLMDHKRIPSFRRNEVCF